MDKIVDNKLIKKITLENGLILEMFDFSRPVAGDRWQVVFEVQINILLKPEYFSDERLSEIEFEDALSLLGNSTIYHYKKERNFIAEDQKTTVMQNMEADFLGTNLGYLSSHGFATGLIKRNYQRAHSQIILSEKKQNMS